MSLYLTFLFIGAAALSAQIIIIRELLVLFYGNEFAVGIILASWLFWSSLGSFLLGRISTRLKKPLTTLMIQVLLLPFLFFLTIIAIRFLAPVLHATPGQLISFEKIILYSFLLPALFCLVNGFLFSLSCQTLHSYSKKENNSVARVYLLEALGAGAGGIITSFFFLRMFNPITTALLFMLFSLFPLWLLYKYEQQRKPPIALFITLILCIILGLFHASRPLNFLTRELEWNRTSLLSTTDSLFGNIVITKNQSQTNLYENGLFLYSIPDISSNEFALQPALLEHKKPQNILVAGGNPGETIEQVFAHKSVQSLTFVEIDPKLITLSLIYASEQAKKLIAEGKVQIIPIDARTFIKHTKDRFDCVILNLPNPFTAQINRFYTKEFFQEIAQILTHNGIFSFSMTSSANYIGAELKDLLSCIYKTLFSVFTDIALIPGDTMHFLCTKTAGLLVKDSNELEKRGRERGINLVYFRSYYLQDLMSPWRISTVRERIKPTKTTPENTDFYPVGYILNLIFWSFSLQGKLGGFLQALQKMNFLWVYLLIPCAFLLAYLVRFIPKKAAKKLYVIPVLTGGFCEMTYQFTIIFSFQVLYGYVYYKLGILFASFMLGTAAGSYFSQRVLKTARVFFHFILIQSFFVLFSLVLPSVILLSSKLSSPSLLYASENILFPLLPALAGFLNGYQFPLANNLYDKNLQYIGKTAGQVYACDLFGSFLGIVLVSIVFIPVFGVIKTCIFTLILNLFSLIVLVGLKNVKRSRLRVHGSRTLRN